MKTTKSLPVLLYHYISRHKDSIAVSPERFEEHCRALAKAGYRGVSLDQAVDFLLDGAPLPPRSVLISFDDGFLDNYVHAYPLLEKYGHRAVVFAATEKLEPAAPVRPTLRDLWDKRINAEALPRVDAPFLPDPLGYPSRKDPFMSWDEARLLERTGVISLAGHSLHHDSVFRGPTPEGRELFRPGPRTRTFDRVRAPVLYGLPRLSMGPALSTRAFVLSDALLELVRKLVPQEPAAADAFFKEPEAEDRVWQELEQLPYEAWGELESEEAFASRVRDELAACRARLISELGGAERSARKALAWPWGKYAPVSLAMAKEAGFAVFFATSFGANLSGAHSGGNPDHVHRFKARDKSAGWLLSRVRIYSRPLLAKFYAGIRI